MNGCYKPKNLLTSLFVHSGYSSSPTQSIRPNSYHRSSNEPFAGAQIHRFAKNGEEEMYRLVRLTVMKSFYVYVLKSLKKDFIYVGFTANLKKRLYGHNSGSEFSTKPYKPFELIFYEAYRNEKDAKRREIYFKTTKGKTTLKVMLREFFDNPALKE